MFYYLLVPLREYFFFFNVFRYITVRTALAGLTALLVSFIFGPWLIKKLKQYQIGQEIREEGPSSHYNKKGTPTMGGVLIIGSTLIPSLLWGNLGNVYIWIAIFSMIAFGLIGFLDDYLKVKKKKSQGLIIRSKLILQFIVASFIGLTLVYLAKFNLFSLNLSFPFFKEWLPYLGWCYLPLIIFIIIGASNAVNLTDGLDGLAIGTTLIAVSAYTALSYIAGHAIWSGYLNILRVPLAGELTVFAGAMAGACLGFLWFNCYPAQIFMGDVGALSLGGTIGTIAILTKQELLLFFVGGLFIIEALSVLIQIFYFKSTGGKRIFKMAPLHHHFEMIGWPETKIVVRFWIVAIIFALFSLTTLKLR
ncbi:MAG: phospho-N-acetylmuramoyl-pentapeptide-transferase [Candidatus Aminicenantia bacterium]